MAHIKTKPRQTIDDYMKLPEGTLAELIEGEIIMSPSPKVRHQEIVANVAAMLRETVRGSHSGRVFIAPLDVHLPSGDIVQPDLIFVASSNAGIIQDWIRGTPDLLVEVVSPENTTHDRVRKRALYARNSVREYWIVDGAARTVEVLVLNDAAAAAAARTGGQAASGTPDYSTPGHGTPDYALHGCFTAGDSITSAVLAGLSLPAIRLFEPA